MKSWRVPVLASVLALFTADALAITGARSVRFTNNRSDWFYMEEVEGISGGVDVFSLSQGATQNQNFTPAFGSSSTGVIDDVFAACCGNGTHGNSDKGLNHQIRVSFPAAANLNQLTLWNRQDGCCPERMDDIQVDYFSGANATGALLGTQRVVGQGVAAGTAAGATVSAATSNLNIAAQTAPGVTAFSSQFNAGQYAATNAVDGVLGANGDWAGIGAGPHTVDLNFGRSMNLSHLMYAQRVNTGSPGVDNATQIQLFFSNNGIFGWTPDVTINNVVPNFNTNMYDLGGTFNAQHVRVQVSGAGGNVGAGEIQFFAPSDPGLQLAPTLIGSAPAFSGAFAASLAIDGNPFTDYASAGQGVNTFLDFDFGQRTLITEVEYFDRQSSGVPQGSGGGGSADNVQLFNLIFSQDSIFGNQDDIIAQYQSPNAADSLQLLINNGEGINARYVRWDVISGAGGNLGVGELRFFTGPIIPEPATAALALVSLPLLARRRRIRTDA